MVLLFESVANAFSLDKEMSLSILALSGDFKCYKFLMVSVRGFKTQVLLVWKIVKRLRKARGSFPFINSLLYRIEHNYKDDGDLCLIVKSAGRLLASIPLDWDLFTINKRGTTIASPTSFPFSERITNRVGRDENTRLTPHRYFQLAK